MYRAFFLDYIYQVINDSSGEEHCLLCFEMKIVKTELWQSMRWHRLCVCGIFLTSLVCCRCSSRPPLWRCPWAWAPPCPWECSTSPKSTSSSFTRSRTSRRGSVASKPWCRRQPCPEPCPRNPTTNRTESPKSSRTDRSKSGAMFLTSTRHKPTLRWLTMSEKSLAGFLSSPLTLDWKTSKDVPGCYFSSHLFR